MLSEQYTRIYINISCIYIYVCVCVYFSVYLIIITNIYIALFFKITQSAVVLFITIFCIS